MSNFGPEAITLFTQATPNGFPISIALEELGLKYNVKSLSFSENEQKQDWFLKICPNGRIPALQDHKRGDFNVFETIAILLYLAQHYDADNKISFDYVKEADLYSEMMQWLAFAQGGLGPMQGQANHFVRYAPEKIEYGMKRYVNESRRLFSVLETRLADRKWLVGDRYSLADIKTFPWVSAAPWATVTDLEFTDYPNIAAWLKRCSERPATHTGLGVPARFDLKEKLANADEEAAKAREWVMKGNK